MRGLRLDVVLISAMAKEKPFNNPFGALKAKQPEKPQPPAPAPAPKKKKEQQVSTDDESALFLSAMGAFDEVKPVREPPPPAVVAARRKQASADDTESLLELAELVIGDAELTVQQTPDSVRAWPKGFDPKLLGKLPPASQLDLQPLQRDAARGALERFVIDAQLRGLRAVRLVTGAAHRALAIDALSKGKLTRKVLAFSGGADALDVLLRR